MRLRLLSCLLSGALCLACGEAPRTAGTANTARGAQCGPTLDFEEINAYDGPLTWVQQREEAVVFVNGACSGVYIGAGGTHAHLVLTAGHCVNAGDRVLVAFNVEADQDGPDISIMGQVLESSSSPDYGLITLGENPQIDPVRLGSRPTRRLASIQHPRGNEKVIATGVFSHVDAGQLFYSDLDTLVGSSGAGLFNANGWVIGIHTGGDCETTGTNFGWQAAAIVRASRVLQDFVVDDC